jgi:hypothetical protein
VAIRFITASTLVAAACALPFASTAHSEVGTVPIPRSVCNLPSGRSLIFWHRVPAEEDRAEIVGEFDLTNCRPMLDELRGPALGPSFPGYCGEIAWASDNPGYLVDVSSAPPLKKVIDEAGDCPT